MLKIRQRVQGPVAGGPEPDFDRQHQEQAEDHRNHRNDARAVSMHAEAVRHMRHHPGDGDEAECVDEHREHDHQRAGEEVLEHGVSCFRAGSYAAKSLRALI
jgi:hypothetical protein